MTEASAGLNFQVLIAVDINGPSRRHRPVKTFKEWWSAAVGDVPPLGWLLRDQLKERWFRVHTLPNAKRYAETEGEFAEVLHRQRAVSAEILREHQPCWLVTPTYGSDERETMRIDEAPSLELAKVDVQVVDDDTMNFWAALVPWEPKEFETALAAVAGDRLRALWAAENGEVFAPYDGGIDVIARSVQRRAELMITFASWRSKHLLGL